jgi:hypothetical protein
MTQDENTELDQELETQEVQREVETSEAESSPASEDKHEEKSNGVQERINQITREKYEERRKREELEAELEKLRNGSQQPQAASQPVETLQAPQLPEDIYDEDAMKQYHRDMQEYVNKASEANTRKFYESQQEAQKKQVTQQEQQALLKQYADNAQKAGVDLDKLANAEKVLNQHRLDPQVAMRLMKDANGPQVITYLADNPAELDEVLRSDPISAAIKIETEIKAKALSTTPKVTKAPDPIPDIGGGGAVELDEFEKKYGKPEFI